MTLGWPLGHPSDEVLICSRFFVVSASRFSLSASFASAWYRKTGLVVNDIICHCHPDQNAIFFLTRIVLASALERAHFVGGLMKTSPSVKQYCAQQGFSSRVCEGGLDYLLAGWEQVVAEVVAGYYALFDEYLNDMDKRRIIAELLPLVSDNERTQILAQLSVLDAQFLAVTRSTDLCLWGEDNAAKYSYRPDRDWWYYRVPTNLSRVLDPENWPQTASSR